MPTRFRTPVVHINRLFLNNPEAIHPGLLNPDNKKLSFSTIINGQERTGGIEVLAAGVAARTALVDVLLNQGNYEGDYHSRTYYTSDGRNWIKTDLYGPETWIEECEAREIDGRGFPCTKEDIDELMKMLTTAEIIVPAQTVHAY